MGFDPGTADSKTEALTTWPQQLRDKKWFSWIFIKKIINLKSLNYNWTKFSSLNIKINNIEWFFKNIFMS